MLLFGSAPGAGPVAGCCLSRGLCFVAMRVEPCEVVEAVVVAGGDVVGVVPYPVAVGVVCGGLALVACACLDLAADGLPVGW